MIPGTDKLRAGKLLAQTNQLPPPGGKTDIELAKEMGLSKARVYQLRLRAMAKIRQAVLEDPELKELAEEICGRRIA